MPAIAATVAYPQGAKFNMDYYLATHMKLVEEKWGPQGLKAWKVVKVEDEKSPYGVMATIEFESEEILNQALQHESSKAVFGDVPNFTDAQPTLIKGIVQASNTL